MKQRCCRVCKVILTDENSYPKSFRAGRICRKCCIRKNHEHHKEKMKDTKYREQHRKKMREWQVKNKPYFREYMRKYMQEHYLTTDGKCIKVSKPPRPEKCELCKQRPAKSWHHWDDNHMEIGLWLCLFCHIFVEIIDNHDYEKRIQDYLNLKKQKMLDLIKF